jgi:hypothetical protein
LQWWYMCYICHAPTLMCLYKKEWCFWSADSRSLYQTTQTRILFSRKQHISLAQLFLQIFWAVWHWKWNFQRHFNPNQSTCMYIHNSNCYSPICMVVWVLIKKGFYIVLYCLIQILAFISMWQLSLWNNIN